MSVPSSRRKAIIGLFDSGVGGLSVWQAVARRLPDQESVYLADGAHCPYGPRPTDQIRRFSLGIARFLIERGADLIVVACNTASAAALESLRVELKVPVVGMEPAIKPAAERTQTGQIGVLATAGTLNGSLFRHTSARYADHVTVHLQVAEGLVEKVEAGHLETPQTLALLRTYLQPMLDAGVDQIVLGCTHYAFLTPVMRRILPNGVSVIDPAAAVAQRVEQVLLSEPGTLSSAANHETMRLSESHGTHARSRFFTTGHTQGLATRVLALTGKAPEVERVGWDAGERYVIWDEQA